LVNQGHLVFSHRLQQEILFQPASVPFDEVLNQIFPVLIWCNAGSCTLWSSILVVNIHIFIAWAWNKCIKKQPGASMINVYWTFKWSRMIVKHNCGSILFLKVVIFPGVDYLLFYMIVIISSRVLFSS
jgi:hypothetical protein